MIFKYYHIKAPCFNDSYKLSACSKNSSSFLRFINLLEPIQRTYSHPSSSVNCLNLFIPILVKAAASSKVRFAFPKLEHFDVSGSYILLSYKSLLTNPQNTRTRKTSIFYICHCHARETLRTIVLSSTLNINRLLSLFCIF